MLEKLISNFCLRKLGHFGTSILLMLKWTQKNGKSNSGSNKTVQNALALAFFFLGFFKKNNDFFAVMSSFLAT